MVKINYLDVLINIHANCYLNDVYKFACNTMGIIKDEIEQGDLQVMGIDSVDMQFVEGAIDNPETPAINLYQSDIIVP